MTEAQVLSAAWDEWGAAMPMLCMTGVDIVRFSLAYDASDEGQTRAKEDLVRLMRGIPTRRQLRAQIERDRMLERVERMRAGQLEEFVQ